MVELIISKKALILCGSMALYSTSSNENIASIAASGINTIRKHPLSSHEGRSLNVAMTFKGTGSLHVGIVAHLMAERTIQAR